MRKGLVVALKHKENRLKRGISVFLAFALFASVAMPFGAPRAFADPNTSYLDISSGLFPEGYHASLAKKGWVVKGKHTYYYRAGQKVTGIQRIGKSYYLFSKKGEMRTGTVRSGDITYYLSAKGKLEACVKKGKFYKPSGKRMAADELKDYKAQLSARKIVKRLTKPSMTKAQKLRICFNWVKKAPYHIYHRFKNVRGWSADFANDHFQRRFRGERVGDCNSAAAALGYLALAIGYKDVRVHVNKKNHGFTEIDGKFYDPYYAKKRGMAGYYGARKGWSKKYTAKLLAPAANNGYQTVKYLGKKPKATKASAASSKKQGLQKTSKGYVYYSKGKKVKSAWKTVKGSKYYFDKNGYAVTGSARIKGTYYVFSAKGKLAKGEGLRTINVDGEKYRVKASGKAAPGWENGKRLYLENGRLATGLSAYKDQLYLFRANGTYDQEATDGVREALASQEDASGFTKWAGEPQKKRSSESCHPLVEEAGGGTDIVYTYPNAVLTFFRYPTGQLILQYFQ